VKEAAKIGFRRAVVPLGNSEKLKSDSGLEITGVRNVEDCIEAIFP
jgi:predicted ATP-dependent serine protease